MKKTRIVAEDVENIIGSIGADKLIERFSNKRFLVAGATGMVGSYFIYVLDKLNEEYDAKIKIVACLRNKTKLDETLLDRVEILEHDVAEEFEGESVDFIVHAASPASPLIMREKPLETNFANTLGTANLIKLALKNKDFGGILFVSSREIYGEPERGQEFFYEDGKLGQVNSLVPRNGYAEGKKAAENMLISAKDEYGLNVKIARLAHTYGPGMSIHDGRVQADFLKNVVSGEDIVLKSDGSSVRTYTYISDAVEAMLRVLIDSSSEVYNIADEKSKVSIKELAETIVELPIAKEKNLKIVFDIDEESKKGAASFTGGILSTDKIRSELNWEPKYSISEGFARTIEHLILESQ
ncbi:NAD-dependent epimerase/dehydratase family protein [Candidatus Saccharibacteria bacterium]|nr:NAD-dependent epimerase/dehydratase family protein [Candidatus Saccharibacteria bacterium]